MPSWIVRVWEWCLAQLIAPMPEGLEWYEIQQERIALGLPPVPHLYGTQSAVVDHLVGPETAPEPEDPTHVDWP